MTFVPGRSNAVSEDTNHGKVLFPTTLCFSVSHTNFESRTFTLFDYLKKDVPLIPYYMESPRNDPKKSNQPFRYNDITVLGGGPEPKTDQFKVSDKNKGRIMAE